MSKIQSVNYQHQSKSAPKNGNYAAAQSFGLGLSDLPKPAQKIFTKEVEKEINGRLGAPSKFFRWLSGWQGELQSQVINNVFTGTLAYYMIAHNPISKQDEKTKKYTAWRQPISAVIAMTAGFGMTVGINRIMDSVYHEGNFETIDLRLVPGKDYLKRAYKDYCKKPGAVKLEGGFKDYMERVREERLDFFTKLLSEDPKTIKFDEKTKAIMINGEDIQKNHLLRAPGFETQQALDKYVGANNFHKRTLGDFLKEKFGFEFLPNGELKPRMTDSKLSNIKAMDFLTEIGLVDDKVTETGVRTTLARYQQSKKVPDNIKILKEEGTKVSADFVSKQFEIDGKLHTRSLQTYMGEEKGKAKVTTLGQLLHQSDVGWTKETSSLHEYAKKPMAEFVNTFKMYFEKFNLEGFEKSKDINHFAKNMLKNSAKQITEHAKNYQKYTGMAFNLITTAISCTILNWAYPRVMERFFPELTKSDKKPDAVKGGNK